MNKQNTRLFLQEEGAALIYPSQNIVVPAEGVDYAGTSKLYPFGSKAKEGTDTYYYCYFSTAMKTGMGAKFLVDISTAGLDWSTLVKAEQIGATTITMTASATLVNNAFQGGWVCINTVPPDTDNAMLQQRRITSSTPCASGGTTILTLDRPLTAAVTTSSAAFAMPSPFSNIGMLASPAVSHIGLATVYTTAGGYYGWVKTRGFCWITDLHEHLGKTNHFRALMWNEQGTLGPHISSDGAGYTAASLHPQQYAGFIVDANTTANGMSMIYLDGLD